MNFEKQFILNNEKSLSERFAHVAMAVSDILALYGHTVRPFKSANDLEFTKLSQDMQAIYLKHFSTYAEVLYETHNSGQNLNEARQLVWNMMKKIGMHTTDDVLNKINNSQIVEIYNSENIQIFRNLPFFKVCSYTLDEVLSVPWWKLYRRDDEMSREIFRYASLILRGEAKSTVYPNLPRHYLREVASSFCFQMNIGINFMAPLVGLQQDRAILVVEEAELIEN